MKIGLIDADWRSRGKCTFPNLSLMKLSAWHKAHGDTVEWCESEATFYDKVYVSKVFSDTYSRDIDFVPNAFEVIRGGSGYAISTIDGVERYDPAKDPSLPDDIFSAFPDYSLYGDLFPDTAYGFLTRGCPRGCTFCHTAAMQGKTCRQVARLSDFWSGQRRIVLLDPNISACPDWERLFEDLAFSGAYVDFSQGIDIRVMTDEKWEVFKAIKTKAVHFAWDQHDYDMRPHIERMARHLKLSRSKYTCYVLTNFGSTFTQDVYRVETLKQYNVAPYVMIYNKPSAPKQTIMLQRYANNPLLRGLRSIREYDRAQKYLHLLEED